MKKVFVFVFTMLSLSLFGQETKFFRHLRYNHVSPYIDIVGIYPIDSITANQTSHYVFKYNNKNKLIEIINNHYHTEKLHPLASLGVHRVVINYQDNKEIRTYFDLNNKRIRNDRMVYKEVFLLDRNGKKIQLDFLDLNDYPMLSNWSIAKYTWKKHKGLVIEKRYDMDGKPVNLSPYFEFGITGIKINKNGTPEAHYNLDENLQIKENDYGIASYQDTYDRIGNHIKYTYHNKKDELKINQWGYAVGIKYYDSIGNNVKLELLDDKEQSVSIRKIYSNSTIKLSKIATKADSLEIKQKSLGYLIALQQLKPSLMDSVMNDGLNKITIGYDRNTGKQFGKKTSKEQMIEFAKKWNKSGAKFPFNPKNEVEILDIYNRIATVKLVSDNWVEYLQLIKLDGNWEIINLIWQHKDIKMYRD